MLNYESELKHLNKKAALINIVDLVGFVTFVLSAYMFFNKNAQQIFPIFSNKLVLAVMLIAGGLTTAWGTYQLYKIGQRIRVVKNVLNT